MEADYTYYLDTTSMCPQCHALVPAKAIIKDNKLLLHKRCSQHGEQTHLWEEDAQWYMTRYQYDKPGTTYTTQTSVNKGCPFDCGLCPDHEQHTCIGLIEVTQNCDLSCPVCYAHSQKGKPHLSLENTERMMDFFIESEGGSAEILQISGGEPTTHPDILRIISLAMSKKIKYVMLNTNGLRIAQDERFVKELAQFRGGFEIYLQYDSGTSVELRGKDLSNIKDQAINNLLKHKIPITLVSTIQAGVNDDKIGEIVSFAMNTPGIRGINFQPVAYFGRIVADNLEHRSTMTGIMNKIESQTKGVIQKTDFVSLPCNVERVALTFFFRKGKDFIPITRKLDIKKYLPLIKNTLEFDASDLQELLNNKSSQACCSCMSFIKEVAPLIPLKVLKMSKEERMNYIDQNIFRITITSFIDEYNFDMKSMKKECVHIITPDLKKIPFSSYNMLHRT